MTIADSVASLEIVEEGFNLKKKNSAQSAPKNLRSHVLFQLRDHAYALALHTVHLYGHGCIAETALYDGKIPFGFQQKEKYKYTSQWVLSASIGLIMKLVKYLEICSKELACGQQLEKVVGIIKELTKKTNTQAVCRNGDILLSTPCPCYR